MASYPYLSAEALSGFEHLGLPIHIFSFTTKNICWSNRLAQTFWGAASHEELQARVLTPMSAATDARLDRYRVAFSRGESFVEDWTFFPEGKAATALTRCSGVRIDGHDEAMLVELYPSPLNALPIDELRAIEALRHTTLNISLFDENGAVLMRNPAAERRFAALDSAPGASADRFAAMFARPDDADHLRKAAQAGSREKRNCIMATSGNPTHAVQVSAVNDPATGDPALLVVQEDISHVVTLSQRLESSEQTVGAILELNVAPTLVVAADDGRILKINAAFEDLIGIQTAPGRSLHDIFVDQAACDLVMHPLSELHLSTAPVQLVTRDGRPRWVLASSAPIVYDHQNAVVMFLADVDQLYRLNEVLETELDLERRTFEHQQRALAVASHDLRTPLAIIDSIAARLTLQDATVQAADLSVRASRIREMVGRLVAVLDKTLEQTRMEDQPFGYRPMPDDLAQCIETVADGFRECAANPVILIILPTIPKLRFDRDLIAQALGNVIENAIKYSDGTAHIEITATVRSQFVQIHIRDQGIGIPDAERDSVLASNVRGSNVPARIGGTGLGLSIVRQIMELHGGLIEIEPGPTGGTTVCLTLPC